MPTGLPTGLPTGSPRVAALIAAAILSLTACASEGPVQPYATDAAVNCAGNSQVFRVQFSWFVAPGAVLMVRVTGFEPAMLF